MPMKTTILLVCLMACLSTGYSQINLLQSFKASDGVASALKFAQTDGMTGAAVRVIATLGDTTGYSSFIPAQYKQLITVKFDMAKGTNTIWLYDIRGKIQNKDTSLTFVMVKVVGLGYQKFDVPLPEIPDNPFTSTETLPATFMDSDIMAQKVSANNVYTTFKSKHTDVKLQAGGLGMSPGGTFPLGPLWSCVFNSATSSARLICFASAADNNGNVTCISQTTDVEQTDGDVLSVYPNPATNDLFLHIPLSEYSPSLSVSLHSMVGELVTQFPITTIAGGTDVHIPTSAIATGTYIVRYSTPTTQKYFRVVIEH